MDTEVLEKKIEALEHAQAESTMKPDLERRFLEVLALLVTNSSKLS